MKTHITDADKLYTTISVVIDTVFTQSFYLENDETL